MASKSADEPIPLLDVPDNAKRGIALFEKSRASQSANLLPNMVTPTTQNTLIRTIKTQHAGRLGAGRSTQVAMTPKGDLLAVATPLGLYTYETDTLELSKFFPTAQPISRIIFSPNGSTLALNYTSTPMVEVWDVGSGQILQQLQTETNVTRQLRFSPDGSLLGVITLDNVYVWQWQENHSLKLLEQEQNDSPTIIKSIAFSPNSQKLALAFINQVELWDLVAQKRLATHTTNEQIAFNVDTLTFSSDGSRLAAGAWSEKRIHLWMVDSEEHLSYIEEPFLLLSSGRSQVTQLAFVPGEQIVVAGLVDGSLHWLDLVGDESRSLATDLGPIRSLVWNSVQNFLIAGGTQGTLQLWHPDTEVMASQLGIPTDGPMADMRHSFLLEQEQILLTERSDGLIQRWNLETHALTAELPDHRFNQVNSLTISPNDGTIGIGLESGFVALLGEQAFYLEDELCCDRFQTVLNKKDTLQNMTISPLAQGIGSVDTVAFSNDGVYIAAATAKPAGYGQWDDTVYLWRHQDGALLHTLQIPYEESVGCGIFHNSVTFSPNGLLLATASYAHKIHLWDVATGALTQTLEGHESGVLAVAFSPDGHFVASASDDQKVIIWQVENGTEYLRLPNHIGGATSVAFSPDGRFLATGSATGQVVLWQLIDGQRAAVLSSNKSPWSNIAFSPDGFLVAIGTKDGQIEIWEVEDGHLRHQFSGHRGSINTLQFGLHSDLFENSSMLSSVEDAENTGLQNDGNVAGHMLVTGGSDGTVNFWSLDIIFDD
ncbi:MAG: WD40 repeat domain-containing protein [Chloroflexota bacterium]